jgi:hypothetical protein
MRTAEARKASSFRQTGIPGTLRLWDAEKGEMLASLPLPHAAECIALHPARPLAFSDVGGLPFLVSLVGVEYGPGIVTASRLWHPGYRGQVPGWAEELTGGCPDCGGRFPVGEAILEVIRAICRDSGLSPEQSPCLQLPPEAWDEPGLHSACPECQASLLFNPFIVDGQREFPSDSAEREDRLPPVRHVSPQAPEEARGQPRAAREARDGAVHLEEDRALLALEEILTPGARLLWTNVLKTQEVYGHEQLGLNHALLALLDRHGAMVESLAPGFDVLAQKKELWRCLEEGKIGARLGKGGIMEEALRRAERGGRGQATERDLAGGLLRKAGFLE